MTAPIDTDFRGRGWAFPIRPAPGGGLAFAEGDEKIRQSIWIILSTAVGERVMRPNFGCGIHELVFEPNTARLHGLLREKVREALTRWEPRIDLLDVGVEAPPGEPSRLLIRVDYRLRDNNALGNLVYPFYVNEGQR